MDTTAYYRDQYGFEHPISYSREVIDAAGPDLPLGADIGDLLSWAEQQRWRIDVDTEIGTLLAYSPYGTTEDEIRAASNVDALHWLLADVPGHYAGDIRVQADLNSAAWLVGLVAVRGIIEDYPLLDDADYSERLYRARRAAAEDEIGFHGAGIVHEYPSLADVDSDSWVDVLVAAQDYCGETGYFPADGFGAY